MIHTYINTPVGILEITGSSTRVEKVFFSNSTLVSTKGLNQINAFPYPILEQFNEYFSGVRRTFDLIVTPNGNLFQKKVWSTLQSIRYGDTVSYSEIALKIGRPKAVRSVATAIGKNPLPIIIPCHRVIGKNGALRGYIGGLKIKQTLLHIEKTFAKITKSFP